MGLPWAEVEPKLGCHPFLERNANKVAFDKYFFENFLKFSTSPLNSTIINLSFFKSNQLTKKIDAILMPRWTREWWYHFQPDGSSGTLRVDFKSFFWQIGPQFCFPSLQITEIVLKEAKQATFKAITIPETFLHFMFKQKAILDLRSFLQYTCFY